MGLNMIVYIDDSIGASRTREKAARDQSVVFSDLDRAGIIVNLPKSQDVPVQIINWLGFVIDHQNGCFHVPDDIISRLKMSLSPLLTATVVPVRSLASVVGKIISMSLALGPVSRLRTRALYAVIKQQIFCSDKLPLSE